MQNVGPKAEPFHDAGPETLDQRIGVVQEVEHLRGRGFVLEIELDDLSSAPRHRLQILAWRRRGRA